MTETDNDDVGSAAKPVVVAVLSYRRPEDIALALPRLAAQAASLKSESWHDANESVMVIDNDPDSSARPTFWYLSTTTRSPQNIGSPS